jgi:putative hydrolase of the HAD superfamily
MALGRMTAAPRRVVLLDALGTLVGLEPPGPALQRELEERHGIEVTLEEAGAALRAEMAFYRAHHDEASDAEGLARLRRRCAEVLRTELPRTAAGLDLDDVQGALLAALRFFGYPEVPGALEELREQGIARIVVSNWDVSLHAVLASTGLTPLVDGVLTSAEVGSSKPAPEIFERALELAGATPADALHVGDSPDHDVAGARAAGIEPVLLVRDPPSRPPVADLAARGDGTDLDGVATVASLAELLALAT